MIDVLRPLETVLLAISIQYLVRPSTEIHGSVSSHSDH